VISIRNLCKSRGGRVVLGGVSAEIARGETVAVLGPSGGGKTTLLHCLNAFEPFDAGAIDIAGFALRPLGQGLAPKDVVTLRTRIGLVFQELHLFSHLSVLDNITLGPRVVRGVTREAAAGKAIELLERVGLRDRAASHPHELSGGQKQRVAIVRALAQDPRVLLLDEPTSALDGATAAGVADTIRELTRGLVTVVLVTHSIDLANRMADRILRLESGVVGESRV
jgi:polar amino acid transport system ATP-binding protein